MSPQCSSQMFLCLQSGRLLACTRVNAFDIRLKCFWRRDRFSSSIAATVSQHGWTAFATFPLKYLSSFSVYRATEMVFSILVTSHYSHTYFMHPWKHRGGFSLKAVLPPLLFILLNRLWWQTHPHIKLYVFRILRVSVERQQLMQKLIKWIRCIYNLHGPDQQSPSSDIYVLLPRMQTYPLSQP